MPLDEFRRAGNLVQLPAYPLSLPSGLHVRSLAEWGALSAVL